MNGQFYAKVNFTIKKITKCFHQTNQYFQFLYVL